MNAEITVSQIYWNDALADSFLTCQAQDILDSLVDRSVDREETLSLIEAFYEDDDVNAFNNDLDTMDDAELAEMYGLTLADDDDDEDDDDDDEDDEDA